MRAVRTSLAVLAGLCALAGTSEARSRAPHLSWVKCASACTDARTVAPGGKVKIAGTRLPKKARVVFPVRGGGTRSLKPISASSTRVVVAVPKDARSGRLYVRGAGGARTNTSRWLWIRKKRNPPAQTSTTPPTGTPFDGNGMWIWYLNKAEGGNLDAIVSRAKAHGITTVFVKSGDGSSYWTQFTPSLVSTLHAAGLHVCAWQYVYGKSPSAEAAVAARSVTQAGADCFVIDAEAEFEKSGMYAAAQTYVDDLRGAVGADFPLAVAGFPYVDYHPSFPYSVFLGPNGAQFNVPQAYWKTIGGSPDTVLAHTYRFNRPYGRTIAPLGQTYDDPPPSDIVRFRQDAAAAGAAGLSWWSWQHTASASWNAVGQGIAPLTSGGPPSDFASLAKGASGDLVLWAQEHLKGAGETVSVDGSFGASTQTAVKDFQTSAGLQATGTIDTATWQALLTHAPAKVKWSAKRSAPRTAKLRAPRYEIPSGIGAG
jgi:Putative peptidoglycan binding domain